MIILRTLLPVIWAIVSCAIAMLLYKTAKAILTHEESMASASRQRRTKISLGGSVAIGAVAFIGMLFGTRETGLASAAMTEQISACRDTFLRISATLGSDMACEDLRRQLDEYILTCKPVMRELDSQP